MRESGGGGRNRREIHGDGLESGSVSLSPAEQCHPAAVSGPLDNPERHIGAQGEFPVSPPAAPPMQTDPTTRDLHRGRPRCLQSPAVDAKESGDGRPPTREGSQHGPPEPHCRSLPHLKNRFVEIRDRRHRVPAPHDLNRHEMPGAIGTGRLEAPHPGRSLENSQGDGLPVNRPLHPGSRGGRSSRQPAFLWHRTRPRPRFPRLCLSGNSGAEKDEQDTKGGARPPGKSRFRQSALTSLTSAVSDFFASPKSIEVLGS